MSVAIEKECVQILEEMLLNILHPFLSSIKIALNRTATSLSTYVNLSICEHSKIAPSVFFILLRVILIYFCTFYS